MSDKPRKVWIKAVPQLLGIAVLAALFLAGIRSDRPPERTLSRFQQVARHLRIGMTAPEAYAVMNFPDGISGQFSSGSWSLFITYFDPGQREFLRLSFISKTDHITGRYEKRLIGWNVSRNPEFRVLPRIP